MKKLLIILFLLIGGNLYSQQTFTQTFVDRCTGEVKIVTANFVNGSATVAFYSRIRTFTYSEFTSGVLQQWLLETYTWWNTLSPCSSATAEAQTAQQTAQTATAAASTAATAASTASTASTSVPTTGGTTNATSNTTGGTTTTDTSGGGSTQSTDTNSSSSTDSTSSESSSGSSEGESTGGGETSEGGGETESESGEAESTSEESSEESSSEESEGDGEEGGDEEESSDDDGDGEESEEEEVEKKEKKEMLPIQLRADMMANQALLGGYDIVTSIGATQSSIFGDETYGATAMIYSNLKQFALNTSYTKVHMEKLNLSSLYHEGHTHYSKTSEITSKDPITPPMPKLKSITSASLGYMNNFGNGTIVLSVMEIKPMGKWGTAGIGVNMVNIFGEGKYQMSMVGYNMLYTNMVMVSPRIQYAPAFIWTQSPYMGTIGFTKNKFGKNDGFAPNQLKGTQIDGMVILSNSFTLQLTRRFSVNVGATFIKSTNPLIPLIKSFAIGSKLPF